MRTIPPPGMGFRLYETPGGQVWSIYSEGVQEFRDHWIRYPVPEIRTFFQTNPPSQLRQLSIFPLRQNHLLLVLPDRLIEFSSESPEKSKPLKLSTSTELARFSEICVARDGGFWIAGAKGLARIRGPLRNPLSGLELEQFVPPSSLNITNLQHPFEDEQGGITLVADSLPEGRRVIVYFNGKEWTVFRTREKVKLAWRDSERAFWAMTSTSILRRGDGMQEFVEDTGISVAQFFDAAIEPSGAFWLASSDGLIRHTPLPWHTPPALEQINGRIHAFAEDSMGQIWAAGVGALHRVDGKSLHSFPYPEAFEKVFQPSDSLWLLPPERLILNADGRLLEFNFHSETFRFLSHPSGRRMKAMGWLRPNVLALYLSGGSNANELQSFDGTAFSKVMDFPPDLKLGEDTTAFLASENGTLWFGGNTTLATYERGTWKSFLPEHGLVPNSALALEETYDGKILCGDTERLWEYNGKTWSVIGRGFERVNAIRKSTSGILWAGANNGIRGLNKDEWVLNSVEEGLPSSAVLTLFEDQKKRIWVGTAHGISLFQADTDLEPPSTTVEKLDPKENNLPEDNITLVFKGRDRWKVTPTDRLLYSYRLDEQEWTPWSVSDAISLPELSGGKHYFQARSIDRSWNIDPNPAVLEFSVALPWYQETRLLLVGLLGCGIAAFFAVLAYNRHRKLVRSYAEIEKTVALRTQQLEKANQELLHSQKMRALGTLSAGIAHDFNNILSIIKGSAQIIETNLEDQEKIQTRVNRIKTVVEQGSGIVKAMLGFSRGREKNLSACDLNAITEETIKLLGDRFLREVDIEVQRATNLPRVHASKDFIQQILLNLIFNAADALNGPGKIILRTGRLGTLSDYVPLQPAPAPEYLFVAVEDFGSGISLETMPRIFEPFFTTKAFSARRGTGLGLSMVYELAKEMGSGLIVKSEVGKGSVFMLVLPLTASGK